MLPGRAPRKVATGRRERGPRECGPRERETVACAWVAGRALRRRMAARRLAKWPRTPKRGPRGRVARGAGAWPRGRVAGGRAYIILLCFTLINVTNIAAEAAPP